MRAGRYIRQPTGFSAFFPERLPPDNPPLKMDSDMQVGLSRADRALGELNGSITTLPDPDLFIFMYVRKEAVLSSQIEGTQSSLTDVLEAEANIMSPTRPGDVDEVINYVRAMNHGLDELQRIPISVRLIKSIHQVLLSGVRGQERQPGEIRRTQNWIGPTGCSIRDALFVPPPPHEVGGLLGDLERFVHEESTLPRLIKIALTHAQFETIHPFLDGNGRVGRLLITFLLCVSEDLSRPVLYLSHYFKRYRSEYYERLQAIRDNGEWEPWIKFFLVGVREVAIEAARTAREIVQLREADREKIVSSCGRATGNVLRIHESLFSSPVVDAHTIVKLVGVTYPAAYQLLNRLIDMGILREITGNERYRKYRYESYVALFAEHRGEDAPDAATLRG